MNEIEKVRINVPDEKELTAAMIQKYIGISREYNVFEFPEAFTSGDKEKLYRMLSYFIANPKSAPLALLIGTFYSHFTKIYQAQFLAGKSEKEMCAALGTYPNKLREIMSLAQRWPLPKIESCMLLLSKFSTVAVGIDNNAHDTERLKELVGILELI